jgi:hypothetical protein
MYNVGRMLERRDFKERFEQNKQTEQRGARLSGERVTDPRRVVPAGVHELEVGKKLRVRLVVR